MSYGIEKMQISFIYSLKKNSIKKDKRKSIMETVKVLNRYSEYYSSGTLREPEGGCSCDS